MATIPRPRINTELKLLGIDTYTLLAIVPDAYELSKAAKWVNNQISTQALISTYTIYGRIVDFIKLYVALTLIGAPDSFTTKAFDEAQKLANANYQNYGGTLKKDLEQAFSEILSNQKILDYIDNELAIFNNKQTYQNAPENANNATKKLYRLIAYSTQYNPPARRHILISSKVKGTNLYKISLGSSQFGQNQSWYDEPLFDSEIQAQHFINNIKNIKTKVDLDQFKVAISDKPLEGQTTLENTSLVNTICGPCYMHTNAHHFGESLNEEDSENKTSARYVKLVSQKSDERNIKARDYQLFDLKKLFRESALISKKYSAFQINCITKFDNRCRVISETDLAYLIFVPVYFRDPKDRSKILDKPEYWKTWVPKHECVIIDSLNEDLTKPSMLEDIEKHDVLNPKLFTDKETLKPEVSAKIKDIVNEFVNMLAEDEIKIEVKDIILVGSNVSYNYTKDSDIDIHIIADTQKLQCPENLYNKLYSAYRSLFNKKFNIEFYDIPVELYVETDETPRVSNGVYSVMQDTWLKVPVQQDIPDIDMEEFNRNFQEWKDRYEEVSNSGSVEEIEQYIDDVYELRKEGLAEGGEYDTRNLTFKEVRNLGYLDNLKELINELKSKELSLENEVELIDNTEEEENPYEVDVDEVLFEMITRTDREKYIQQIRQAVFDQPIIQDNGLFHIYLVKEADVNDKLARLKRLNFIQNVHATPGKYDFSKIDFRNGMPSRYYTITGQIKN